MEFFTDQEFLDKYSNFDDIEKETIIEASEMIFAQVSPCFRDNNWDDTTVPKAVKNASMEQLRFIEEYDIPSLDNRGSIEAGAMKSDLISDISKDALRILGNAGLLYRGNPINYNMGINLPFGD